MAHQAHHIKCPTQRTSSSHPSQPGNSFSSTPCSFPRVRSLSYSVIDNWYFHSFSLHFSLFPFTIFYYPKWMRPYIDYPSPIVYFPSALYPPVPSTSKQVVGLCRFYYFLFFLYLLRSDLWPGMWSILENVSCALEKNVYSATFGWNVLNICIMFTWSSVSFKAIVSLLIFYLYVLFICC